MQSSHHAMKHRHPSSAICGWLSNVISSQLFHGKYGGVVPELASRAHLKSISEIVAASLLQAGLTIEDITALAVTSQPGLIGSLIVGSNFAKGLALKYNLPIVPINHIEGHIFSGCLEDETVEFPFITLVVSGGHTALFYVESYNKYSLIGSTLDDAAGEAFDKIASMLKLSYPGGPLIDNLAKNGNSKAYNFPRSMINSHDFSFSFSGLKTSVRYFINKTFPDGVPDEALADLCASVQQAIIEVLVSKTIDALLFYKCKTIVIGGGVSANSGLRALLQGEASKRNLKLVLPRMNYCMDNAAMIGFLAEMKLNRTSDISMYYNLEFKVNSNSLRQKRVKS